MSERRPQSQCLEPVKRVWWKRLWFCLWEPKCEANLAFTRPAPMPRRRCWVFVSLYFALLAISREDDYRHASFSIIDGNCCGIMPLNLWPNWKKIGTTGPPTGKSRLAKIDRARETRLDVTDTTCFVTTWICGVPHATTKDFCYIYVLYAVIRLFLQSPVTVQCKIELTFILSFLSLFSCQMQ